MNRRIRLVALALLAAMSLSGCALPTVQDMYHPPKRSEDYYHLQSAIDEAMAGLSYSAPLSGENQQTVQKADLTGDGVDEYLLFAKGDSDMPMRILIFHREAEKYRLLTTIEGHGSAFEQVEYVDIDDQPGVEIVVGRQMSDQVLRSVSVYTFAGGKAEQLMSTNYYKFLTCDLDRNGKSELMVIHPGQSETDNAIAVLYSFLNGVMERSAEAGLSEQAASVKRIMVGKLHGGHPAVYVASAVDESAIITDIFALKTGKFTNISFSNESGTSVQTLRNYYVYADDIDGDGILELPSLITMPSVQARLSTDRQYLIRWFAMDLDGSEVDKLYTFHNYLRGWYLELGGDWAQQLSVEQEDGAYVFYVWDEAYQNCERILSIHVFTGADREDEAAASNRFVLYRTEDLVYAARLEAASAAYGITQESLINSFHLIRQDWKTGET